MTFGQAYKRSCAERLICALVLALAWCLFLFAPHQAQGKAMRAGVMYNDPQFLTIRADGQISGYAYEYVQMLAQYRGWEVEYVPGTMDECRNRLAGGEIDFIAGVPAVQGRGMILSPIIMSVVHRNYLQPLYLAVREGNQSLAKELFDTEQQVLVDYPNGRHYLEVKYFQSSNIGSPLVLTIDETSFLEQHSTLRVAVQSGDLPLSGYVDGTYVGVYALLLERLARDLGLSYEVVPVSNPGEAYQALKEGRADVILGVATDFGWAAERDIYLSAPFMRQNYVKVSTRGQDKVRTSGVVAAPRQYYYAETYIRNHYGEEHIRWYDTFEECLQAVSDGKADFTYMEAAVAQYHIFRAGFYDLMTNGDVDISHDVSLAVPATDEGRELLIIINRELDTLPLNFMESLDSRAIVGSDNMRRLAAFVYNYPLHFFLGTAALSLAVVLVLIHALRMRRQHVLEMQELSNTDFWTKRHNWRWFMNEVPEMLSGELAEKARKGVLAILRIDMQQADPVSAGSNMESLPEQLDRLAKRLQADFPEVGCLSVAGLAGFIIAICALDVPEAKADEEPSKAAMDDFVLRLERRLGRYGREENELSFQAVSLRAGLCRLRGRADFARAVQGAEAALAECYREGHSLCTFNAALEKRLSEKRTIEMEMEQALEAGEFRVWYQPKYDIKTRETVGAEALVRWNSSKLGFLPPGRFINIFEENGFIVKLDNFVLEETCRMQKRRLEEGLKVVPVSVNQSRMHFLRKDYLDYMQAVKQKYGLPDGMVSLELTETAFSFIDHPDRRSWAMGVIHSLHEMGYQISMDDFGSGYSSLELLNLLPLDVMKLDRTLLGHQEDGRMEKILSASIDLGNSLKMDVICEGIEDVSQEALLLKYGCRYGQGYLYAKPMPREEFEDFLSRH